MLIGIEWRRNARDAGTSLVVQWLRIQLAMQGTWVQSLVREVRSHMLWGNEAHVPGHVP